MKNLCRILSVLLIVMLMPASAFAEGGQDGDASASSKIHIYMDETDITDKMIAPDYTTNAYMVGGCVLAELKAVDGNGDPVDDVEWKSENEDYLSVEQNKTNKAECEVKMHISRPGIGHDVRIYAFSPEGEAVSTIVRVKTPDLHIELAEKSKKLEVGKQQKVKVIFKDSSNTEAQFCKDTRFWYVKNVKITSSDPTVIDAAETTLYSSDRDGLYALGLKVTPKKCGSAILTLSMDNDYGKWSYQVECSTATGIKGLNSYYILEPGDEIDTSGVKVQPDTASQEVKYTSDKPDVADVVDGKILAKSTGSCTVTASADQGNGTVYEYKISVKVIKAGIYQLYKDEKGDYNYDPSSWKSLDGNELTVTDDEPVYISYFSKKSPTLGGNGYFGYYIQSSNTDVADVVYSYGGPTPELKMKANGTTYVRVIGYERENADSDFEYSALENSPIKVVVNNPAFKDAPEDKMGEYPSTGQSAANDTFLKLNEDNISTVTSNGWFFENYIGTPKDKKDLEFSYTVSSRKGDGNPKPEDYLQRYMLKHITICDIGKDKNDFSKVVASFGEDGTAEDKGLTVVSTEEKGKKNPVSVRFKVDPKSLEYDHEYALVFDMGFRLNDRVGREAVFYFKTKPAEAIKLDKTEATIIKGDTLQLGVLKDNEDNEKYEGKVEWKTSDEKVATVDENGTVKAAGLGTAVITAATEDGATAECKVTVEAEAIKLDKTEATIIKGDTLQLGVLKDNEDNEKYEGKVEWKTSDEKVATVDENGTVKASGVGTAVITVASEDGATAECKVTVEVPDAPSGISAVSKSYNQIKVSWNKVSGADGYKVSYGTSSKCSTKTVYVKSSARSYVFKGLKTGRKYYVRVCAYKTVDGKKVVGSPSSVKSVKPVPAKQTSFKVKAGTKKFTASWKKVSGACGYKVYYSTKRSGNYKAKVVKGNSKVKYTVKNLKKGKTYYVKSRAYRVVNGKKVYGPYTSTVRVRVK